MKFWLIKKQNSDSTWNAAKRGYHIQVYILANSFLYFLINFSWELRRKTLLEEGMGTQNFIFEKILLAVFMWKDKAIRCEYLKQPWRETKLSLL
jgi:hypothetical protein